MPEGPTGPLAGIRVVELATVVAGPGTGKYLADFGAEVVKVEAPGGDPTRRMGWTGPGEADSYFWKLLNRNKLSVTLDLKLTYLRPLSVRSGIVSAEGRLIKLGRQTSYTEGFVRDGAGNLAVHATATFSMIGEPAKAK